MQLVLVGGGHSHSIVLKKLGMLKNNRAIVTLISPTSSTPYSGMIPGLVSGTYETSDCFIDLRHLSNFAGAKFIRDFAVGIDSAGKYISLKNSPPIKYDILSIDIGSTPGNNFSTDNPQISGIKPIPQFLDKVFLFEKRLNSNNRINRITLVGGGAGGIEIALALRNRFKHLGNKVEIVVLEKNHVILPGYPAGARRKIYQTLKNQNIDVITGETVRDFKVRAIPDESAQIVCESGRILEADFIIIATPATPHPWLEFTPLKKDKRGFIEVLSTLQSVSHPEIFASGDTASLINHTLEKSGVYAVRQGKILFQNIIRMIEGRSMTAYKPQKNFLSLISTGNRQAIARRQNFSLGPYEWLWNWKDSIDHKFMNLFRNLPAGTMMKTQSQPENSEPRCAGCGSKVGSGVLHRALNRITTPRLKEIPDTEPFFSKITRILQDEIRYYSSGRVILGLEDADDSAVLSLPTGKYAIQTVDAFRPIVSDLYLAGKITTNHCLNDIYAMGGIPDSAMALITLPAVSERDAEEDIVRLLSGVVASLEEEKCKLVGGHTTEGRELLIGLSCTGLVDIGSLLQKKNIQIGDILILTKPLGVGVLFAMDMRNLSKSHWVDSAIESMLHSNRRAMEIFKKFGVRAITDISGFGLAGHLLGLLRSSGYGARIDLHSLPLLEGVGECLRDFPTIQSTIYQSNRISYEPYLDRAPGYSTLLYPMLFDPQTSGGLLGAIPKENADACFHALKEKSYGISIIGTVTGRENNIVTII